MLPTSGEAPPPPDATGTVGEDSVTTGRSTVSFSDHSTKDMGGSSTTGSRGGPPGHKGITDSRL